MVPADAVIIVINSCKAKSNSMKQLALVLPLFHVQHIDGSSCVALLRSSIPVALRIRNVRLVSHRIFLWAQLDDLPVLDYFSIQ